MLAAEKQTYCFYCHSIPFNGKTVSEKPLGGSESAVVYLARELARRGNRVVVFTDTPEPGLYDGVQYYHLGDFLHYIQTTIMDAFISVREVSLFEQPIMARERILWVHDDVDQPHLEGLMNKKLTDCIDQVVAVSEWQKTQYEAKFPLLSGKIQVIANGIEKSYFRKYFKRRKKKLVYTATPFRGLDILLDVFGKIKARVPDVELDVFSSMKVYGLNEEQDRERFGNLYDKCNQPGVSWRGSVRQEELAKELSRASVFVYPNCFAETSCIAALEAQAAGLPCVVSRLGALPETVLDGVTGSLIEGDPRTETFQRAFVEAIVRYLEDPDFWQQHSVAAHEHVLTSHTWRHLASEWDEMVSESRPTLSLCMIVKNEEDQILGCLDSVKAIADELIVVDTGSSDKTLSLLKGTPAKVFKYKWSEDFSAARNFSLSKATSEWILVLDADERMSIKDALQIRKLLNLKTVVAYRLIQRSYTNDVQTSGWIANETSYEEGKEFAGYHNSLLVRLFRNGLKFEFRGKVHELIEPSIMELNHTPTMTDIPIHHFGKVVSSERYETKSHLYLEVGKKKIKDSPDDFRPYQELAIQYVEVGDFEQAAHYFKETLKRNQNNPKALSDLGSVHMQQDNPDQGMLCFKKAIAIDDKFIPAYLNLSLIYQDQDKLDLAEECLEKVTALNEKQPLALKHLGRIHYLRRDFAGALEFFKKLKKIDPSLYHCDEAALSWYELAKVYFRNNDFKVARKYLEESLTLRPFFPEAMNYLGIVLVRLNQFERARQTFDEVVTMCTVDQRFKRILVQAYVNLGYIENYFSRFDAARKQLKQALELSPRDVEANNHMGISLCGLGELDKAMKYFDAVLKVAPNHQGALVNKHRVNEILVKEANQTVLD